MHYDSVSLYWMSRPISFYFLKDLLQHCEACHCDHIGVSTIIILCTIHLYMLKCSPWNLPTGKSSCHGRLQKKEEQILTKVYKNISIKDVGMTVKSRETSAVYMQQHRG